MLIALNCCDYGERKIMFTMATYWLQLRMMLFWKFLLEIQAFDIGAEIYSFCAILRHVNFNFTMYRKENLIQENLNLISRAPARLLLKICLRLVFWSNKKYPNIKTSIAQKNGCQNNSTKFAVIILLPHQNTFLTLQGSMWGKITPKLSLFIWRLGHAGRVTKGAPPARNQISEVW